MTLDELHETSFNEHILYTHAIWTYRQTNRQTEKIQATHIKMDGQPNKQTDYIYYSLSSPFSGTTTYGDSTLISISYTCISEIISWKLHLL